MADRAGSDPPILNSMRPRALLLGATAVLALALLIPYVYLVLGKYDWAFRPLPTGPVFILFLLALPINTVLRRVRPSWAFTGPELLLVYAMMAICAALASEGLFGYTLVNAVHPHYFASPENRWLETIVPHVPMWLQVDQREAVVWFFEGRPGRTSRGPCGSCPCCHGRALRLRCMPRSSRWGA